MTKDEFEQGYAARSGITIERLHALGRHAAPCDCGDESCKGWQMLSDHVEPETGPTLVFVHGVSADELRAHVEGISTLGRYRGMTIVPSDSVHVIVLQLARHGVEPLPEGEP